MTDSINQDRTGSRAVVVVDRGWIFAGDILDSAGRIYLSRAVWIFKWSLVGFAAVIENPDNENVIIRRISDVDIPAGAEIFRIPVVDDWGL